MLEKIVGIYLVDKLRAIQLYKVNFNFYNQFFLTQSNGHNYEKRPSTWRAVQPKRQHIGGCQAWLNTDNWLVQTDQTTYDHSISRHSQLLQKGQQCNNVVDLANTPKRKHPTNSVRINMLTDNAIFSANRPWWIQYILWWIESAEIHYGTGTRKQSGTPVMDSSEQY